MTLLWFDQREFIESLTDARNRPLRKGTEPMPLHDSYPVLRAQWHSESRFQWIRQFYDCVVWDPCAAQANNPMADFRLSPWCKRAFAGGAISLMQCRRWSAVLIKETGRRKFFGQKQQDRAAWWQSGWAKGSRRSGVCRQIFGIKECSGTHAKAGRRASTGVASFPRTSEQTPAGDRLRA